MQNFMFKNNDNCTKVRSSTGLASHLVVVRPYVGNETGILNLETMKWSVGPALPVEPFSMATVVPYGNSFLAIGGRK